MSTAAHTHSQQQIKEAILSIIKSGSGWSQSVPATSTENADLKLWREKLLAELRLPPAKASKKLTQALKKGVPSEIRGLAWQTMIGNELRITDKLYELLLERAHLHMT
jgi:hypothetical protein